MGKVTVSAIETHVQREISARPTASVYSNGPRFIA